MRIVSKFHDYYDSVMRHGQDLTTIFIRKAEPLGKKSPEALLLTRPDPFYHRYISTRQHRPKILGTEVQAISIAAFRVYFCGKTYRGVQVSFEIRWNVDLAVQRLRYATDYFYNLEDLKTFLQRFGLLVQDIYKRDFSFQKGGDAPLATFLGRQGTEENFDHLVSNRVVIARSTLVVDDPAVETNIFDRDYPTWIVNPCLKDTKFFKLIDPFTAYQELDMYLSGVLGQQAKETSNISDRDRIHQRGFDEYSFRKLPEEKKRNR